MNIEEKNKKVWNWPRSNQLTELEKKEKLEMCKRNIETENRKPGHDMRILNEKHCLMNIDELNEQYPGGAPEDDNKPIEGKQKCYGAGCKLIVPIAKANISWRTYEEEETILVTKRSRRQADEPSNQWVEEKIYCRYEEFDLRKDAKTELCRQKIGEIVNQGNCPSCTFAATAPAINGRYCMATAIYQTKHGQIIDACKQSTIDMVEHSKRMCAVFEMEPCFEMLRKYCKFLEKNQVSIREPMECMAKACQQQVECMANNCQNSSTREQIWKFHSETHIVMESCKPYRCCQNQPKTYKCCSYSKGCDSWESCDSSSFDKTQKYTYRTLVHTQHLSGTEFMETIMEEIKTNGPVTAGFLYYNDFGEMGKKIYMVTENAKQNGAHAVRLIGFGEKYCSNTRSGPTLFTTKYWIAANSWGKGWNVDGTFRIRRGSNEAGIENNFAYGHFCQWNQLRPMFGDEFESGCNVVIVGGEE